MQFMNKIWKLQWNQTVTIITRKQFFFNHKCKISICFFSQPLLISISLILYLTVKIPIFITLSPPLHRQPLFWVCPVAFNTSPQRYFYGSKDFQGVAWTLTTGKCFMIFFEVGGRATLRGDNACLGGGGQLTPPLLGPNDVPDTNM